MSKRCEDLRRWGLAWPSTEGYWIMADALLHACACVRACCLVSSSSLSWWRDKEQGPLPRGSSSSPQPLLALIPTATYSATVEYAHHGCHSRDCRQSVSSADGQALNCRNAHHSAAARVVQVTPASSPLPAALTS
ncbi:hypothetical protein CC78DRAFT_578533 [Lojkania enalia]|uniref:Uncharacterized protein n=1 Tax=Lojkania enalia TaxID=147567 RepID=A0A9P4N1K9_9PLEO|nr:hypothetical protein CC78DRAFT_578533 [Didymosphaeria enalia]